MKNLTEIIKIALVMLPLTSAAQMVDTTIVPPRIEYKKPAPICYTVDPDGTLVLVNCEEVFATLEKNEEDK